MRIKFLLIIFLFTGFIFESKSSVNPDSLRIVLRNEKHDTVVMKINNQLSGYFTKRNPDSAIFYVNKSIEIGKQTSEFSDDEVKLAYKVNLANSYTLLGDAYKATGSYDKAISSYANALDIRKEIEDFEGKGRSFINIGIIKSNQGKYFEALDYFQLAEKELKNSNNNRLIAKLYRNIGNVYYYQGEWDYALSSYQKSLQKSDEIKDFWSVSRCQNNIAMVHKNTERYDWAIDYFNKSLEIKKQINDIRGVATVYNNLGEVYFKQKNFDKALQDYNKSLQIRRKVKDSRGVAFSLNNIGKLFVAKNNYTGADTCYKSALKILMRLEDKEQMSLVYTEIAEIKFRQSNYAKAIEYAKMSLDIAKELETLPRLRDAYEILYKSYAQIYKTNKDFKYYQLNFEYFKKYIGARDSIYDKKSDDIMKKEQRYRLDRKEQENKNLKLEQEKQKADEENLRMQMYLLLFGLAVVAIFAVFVFRNYKQKAKANELLRKQKEALQKAKEEIENQKKEIEDSIIYAQNIQKAVMPSKDYREQILPEHFIFFRPRNIVSGDFFWIKKVDKFIVVAAADCTGHGVPGAFMSMLGFMFLNDTVTLKNIPNAGLILDKVRNSVKESLHQSGKVGEAKDGMDMSFFIINTETNQLNFSGAFNPLYIIRENSEIDNLEEIEQTEGFKIHKQKSKIHDAQLIEIKGDRQPIAIYSYEKPFSNYSFQLKKGDRLYSFSDGYPDQFGGSEGKKFNAKRFKEMLLEIRNQDMATQKELINKNFFEWMGEHEQVDDVLLIGLKIG